MKNHAWLYAMAILIVGCTTGTGTGTNDDPPEELDNYEVTGQTENCLGIGRIRQTRVLDDQHILFIMRGGATYLSKLPHRCARLGFNEAFTYATSLSQLCNTDIITVIDRHGGITASSCGLGIFQELSEITPEPTP